ncbi:MAG TPA: cyanase [Candidatus Angelobacter sp.]|nr:cyanase [Candidatus Angelobacter sp.]
MNRQQCTAAILEAKTAKGLSFQKIADHVGRHVVWTTAALMGQHPMSAEEAQKAVEILGLEPTAALALQQFPMRGSLPETPPTDSVIYRFYEIVQVYGTTLKAVIHEQFGDGIMSAIDFSMDVQKVPDPKGDRVRVTMEGKFLPYKKW